MTDETTDYGARIQAWAQSSDRLEEEVGEYLYALTAELNSMGVELGLATVLIRTLHPQLDMLAIRWRPLGVDEVPTEGTESIIGQRTIKRPSGVQDIYPLSRGHADEETWLTSPFHKVLQDQESLRVPLERPPSPAPFPIIEDLIERGMTDYIACPIPPPKQVKVVISLATRRAGGFPEGFVEGLLDSIPALSIGLAFNVQRFLFEQVLSAYIGEEPASLVLQGQIHQGDLVSRRAALGFADLRGFTAATERLPREQLVELINAFFERVHGAVHRAGGEILKFMGDGVLFMVPDDGDAGDTCDRALGAVMTLKETIERRNQAQPDRVIEFGCALHYGEVLYGNMGAASRLDFTVMGSDVNLASRIESLTGDLGETLLLSEHFSGLLSSNTRLVGEFQFKGVSEAQPVYAPVAEP